MHYTDYPKIIQKDNGLECANNLIKDFLINNNIVHIKRRPLYPQTNGVVEVFHKEIRKCVLLEYSKYSKDFNLKNALLNEVNKHNHNIYSTTGFKPVDLSNNNDES